METLVPNNLNLITLCQEKLAIHLKNIGAALHLKGDNNMTNKVYQARQKIRKINEVLKAMESIPKDFRNELTKQSYDMMIKALYVASHEAIQYDIEDRNHA